MTVYHTISLPPAAAMLGLKSFLVLVSMLQGVIPDNSGEALCGRPPVDKPFECCKLPVLFSDEDRAECGLPGREEPRKGPPDCAKNICIMKKKNLMKDDENLDLDAVSAFLDKYTEENTEFKETVENAKDICLKENLPGPPGICGPSKVISCLFFEVFHNCPTWEKSEKCDKLLKHINQCRAKFV